MEDVLKKITEENNKNGSNFDKLEKSLTKKLRIINKDQVVKK